MSLGSAGAQTPGVGTATAQSTALAIQLGDGSLLDLSLLQDSGRATIDPAIASPEAFSNLAVLKVSSTLVPGLNLTIPTTPVESRTPGGEPSVQYGAAAFPTPAAILSGNIVPASLTSSLVDNVANSTVLSEINSLGIVGQLANADVVKSVLDTTGNPTSATATRSANVGKINVLDLGGLLEGLGIPLAELPVATVTALVDQLRATVGNVSVGGLTTLVNDLLAQQSALQALPLDSVVGAPVVDGLTGDLPLVGGLLGGGLVPGVTGIVPPVAGTTLVGDVLGQVTGLLNSVLGTALTTLDNLSLLSIDGLSLGTVAKAAETVEGSVAQATGTIGNVTVGGIQIPGIDLLGAADQVNALAGTVTSTIGGVLATVDPGLANLVKVAVLDKTTNITNSGGYVRSNADLTGLTASIVPPAALTSIVQGIVGTAGIGSVLGSSLPVLSGAMPQLGSLLNLPATVGALSQGAVVRVASLQSASQFTAVAPVSVPTLPRTGGPAGLAVLGVLFAALAFGILRFLHVPGRGVAQP